MTKVKGIGDLVEKIPKSLAARKKTYQRNIWATLKHFRKKYLRLGNPAYYIWIFGCQRSGTTLLERIFRSDLDSAVFGEFSELAILPKRTVLKDLPEVGIALGSCNARYAVVRPLFESDRAAEILNHFPQSIAVWMIRDPRYVVNSMINKWGDNFFEISRSVEAGSDGKWRLERLYESIKTEAKQITGGKESIEDIYALYWYRRNLSIYEAGLNENARILFLNYDQLVNEPKKCIDRIIKQAQGKGVWRYFYTDASPVSMSRNIILTMSPEVEKRCYRLYAELCDLNNRDFSYRMN